jgi:hypothetical protein
LNCTKRIEKIEDLQGVSLYAQFMGRPGRIGNITFKILHLKPVFNIYGQKDGRIHYLSANYELAYNGSVLFIVIATFLVDYAT